jgi:hypothetical protein
VQFISNIPGRRTLSYCDDSYLHVSVKVLSLFEDMVKPFKGTTDPVAGRYGGARRGQTSVEYLITAGMLIASVAILAVFLYTFKEYGGRVLDLVASEYP